MIPRGDSRASEKFPSACHLAKCMFIKVVVDATLQMLIWNVNTLSKRGRARAHRAPITPYTGCDTRLTLNIAPTVQSACIHTIAHTQQRMRRDRFVKFHSLQHMFDMCEAYISEFHWIMQLHECGLQSLRDSGKSHKIIYISMNLHHVP